MRTAIDLRCQDQRDNQTALAGLMFGDRVLLMLDDAGTKQIRPKMSDVAAAAGVSLKSVSRVINNESHISPKLRAKVERAISELAYVPDPAARSLAGARSFTIGVLFDNPSPNYTMKVQSGAYQGCRDAGYHLRIDNLDHNAADADFERQLREILRGSRVDGFVLTPPHSDDPRLLARLEEQAIPYVRIAPVIDPGRSPAVDFDDRAAAAMLADHLLALGHRRFGLVSGPSQHRRAQFRKDGFVSRLAEICPQATVVIEDGSFSFASGMEAGHRLLATSQPPTAIFAANDDMAAGVMSAAMQAGLRLPDDLSVCGFDDSWISMAVHPPLTTIRQPIEEMARTGVDLLLQAKPGEMVTQELPFDFVERESTGSPAHR
jgi:LacI family transcriptional regulator